jgi:SAM-dependent methyltransferase
MTAPTKTITIDEDVAAILKRGTFLTDGPLVWRFSAMDAGLPRELYRGVNRALDALGGKWDRGLRGHVFDEGDAADRMAEALIGRGIVIEKLGWFPTPEPLVDRLLELAEIEPHHLVLEPSAGRGAIAARVRELVAESNLYCVEIDAKRCDSLREQGIYCMFGDFLSVPWIDELDGGFDRVVMNPPFENGQAWTHIKHAYALLKPGGRLVSVAPAIFTELRMLRQAMPYADTIWREQNAEGAFKVSGTAVRTQTVMLDKDPA